MIADITWQKPNITPLVINWDDHHSGKTEDIVLSGRQVRWILILIIVKSSSSNNNIDGIEKTNGLFTVITTNKIDKLDDALGIPRENQNGTMISTRPGRIDRAIELKELDEDCRKKIAKRILCDFPDKTSVMVKKGEGDTGAQFQERCMQLALKLYWENK